MRPRTCTCGECSSCRNTAKSRRWAAAHPDYGAQVQRERRRDPERGERVRSYERERYAADPEYRQRKKARAALNHAVRTGKVQRQPCAVCGTEPAEAHHADYSRPLDVRWLCTDHHLAEHGHP